jgi:DNA-directed RNA polymerase subunit alpha
MSEDGKKITDEMLARITALEEKIREIRIDHLVLVENELGTMRRDLGRLVRVQVPIMSPSTCPSNPFEPVTGLEDRLVDRGLLDKQVDDLELSVRSANCFCYALGKPIRRVGDLIMFTQTDLLRLKNFGRKSLREVNGRLREMGLALGSVHMEWEPSPDSAKPGDIWHAHVAGERT